MERDANERHGEREARVSDKEVIALLIQELQECKPDAKKASAIMDTYQLFLSPPNLLENMPSSLLLLAVERGSLLLVRYLVEKGVSIEPRDASEAKNPSALAAACGFNHLEIVQYLVSRGAQINRAEDVASPLSVAIRGGHERIVEWLLDSGVHTIDASGATGHTPLMSAVASGRLRIVKLLVSRGADTTVLTRSTRLDLRSVAAMSGHLSVLKYFDESGIGRCAGGGSEWSALKSAVTHRQIDVVRYLVERGELTHDDASAYLRLALAFNSAEIAEMMIVQGADVNAVERNTKVPLHMAIEAGMDGVVELLLSRGADFRQTVDPMTWFNALHLMARYGRLEMLKAAHRVAGADIDYAAFNVPVFDEHVQDQTPLSLAAMHGHAEVVAFLLGSTPSPQRTPAAVAKHLHSALRCAAESSHIDVLRLLIARGARIEDVDSGTSALSDAAAEGHFEAVRYLCENGADADFESGLRGSVLQAAARGGSVDIVQYLVEERHVDVSKVAGEIGRTALDAGAAHLDVVQVLLSYGGDDLQASSKSLCAAALRGNLDVLKRLVASGAEVNQVYVPDDGYTQFQLYPLLVACYVGTLEIVECLCEAGADIESISERGESALFLAAANGCLSAVKYLVEEQNANIESANWLGITPAEVAKTEEHDDVFAYLISRGANPPKLELMSYEESEEFDGGYGHETPLTMSEKVSVAYWERETDFRSTIDQLQV